VGATTVLAKSATLSTSCWWWHVALADVAMRLGRAAAADSSLKIEKIVAAAVVTGAQAIHPGHGFLAENAVSGTACAAAAALTIGSPALIKPSAGASGKGMHLVRTESEVKTAIASARREAASSFGDDTLFIERFMQNPRHIEVQVLADNEGNTVHLGKRECSLERRYQKVIEEAPSPLLDEVTRGRIGQAAVDTAKSVSYRGAGTVEFIVFADSPEEFFFREMNTRLQVEHLFTEIVTGVDLVEWRLRIAAGEDLDFGQDDVVLTGHAIEARIYGEKPEHVFHPTGVTVLSLMHPAGQSVRVDSAPIEGLIVSSDYDPMLLEVIVWAADRAGALQRLRAALTDTVTLVVSNNIEFLPLLPAEPDVVASRFDTELIKKHLDRLAFRAADADIFAAAALIMHARGFPGRDAGPWQQQTGWCLGWRHHPSTGWPVPAGQHTTRGSQLGARVSARRMMSSSQ